MTTTDIGTVFIRSGLAANQRQDARWVERQIRDGDSKGPQGINHGQGDSRRTRHQTTLAYPFYSVQRKW